MTKDGWYGVSLHAGYIWSRAALESATGFRYEQYTLRPQYIFWQVGCGHKLEDMASTWFPWPNMFITLYR